MLPMHRKLIALSIAIAVFVAHPCLAAEEPEKAKDAAAERDIAHAELEVLNLTATPSINSLTFRGTVRNSYDQPIDGIRLIMQVRSDPKPEAPELGRAQKVLEARLAPGEHTAFDIAVKIDPASLAEPGLLLRAYAMKRGEEVLSRPPIWRE
jgi:hypothetical protein